MFAKVFIKFLSIGAVVVLTGCVSQVQNPKNFNKVKFPFFSFFYKSISSYNLPENRLQIVLDKKIKIFRDFAHSPSKLNSTIDAVKNNYKNKLLVIYELHSSSSLNINFLPKYKNTINQSDDCIIYLSQKILDKNKIKNIDLTLLKRCFNNKKLRKVLCTFKRTPVSSLGG